MNNIKRLIIVLIIIFSIIVMFLCILINSKKEHDTRDKETTIVDEKTYKNNTEGLNLLIEGMSLQTKQKISNIEEFEQRLKEYSYENNLVDYGNVNLQMLEEAQKGNILSLKLQTKDTSKIKIIVDINLNENTYDFLQL